MEKLDCAEVSLEHPAFIQNRRQKGQANHRRALFNFDKMRRFDFDNLKNAALFDAEYLGGLFRRQHRFTAFRAGDLSARRGLANEVTAINNSQQLKFAFDFHLFATKIKFV